MTIKTWFMEKNFTAAERYAMVGDPTVTRETEKAVCLSWNTDFGKIARWVPKSCIITDAEMAAENTPEKCAARLSAIQAREASYQTLIDLCKANGIAARKGMKVSTMKAKLAAAGVAC